MVGDLLAGGVERLWRGESWMLLSVRSARDGGWEVRAERDREVIWVKRYRDWHRVERARAVQSSRLREAGWVEEHR